jgi:prepilin-type processing-associated H-X9-DG protein
MTDKRKVFIVSVVMAFALVTLLVSVRVWAKRVNKDKWGSIVCRVNVSLLSLACAEYAKEHGDTLPASLDELRPYLSTALQQLKARPNENPYLKVWEDHGGRSDPFVCPLSKSQPAYEIVGAGKKIQNGDKSEILVVREVEPNHNRNRGYNIGYLDGHVNYMDEAEQAAAYKQ